MSVSASDGLLAPVFITKSHHSTELHQSCLYGEIAHAECYAPLLDGGQRPLV